MAVVVTPNLTLISNCDALGSWSSGTVNTDFKLEGTGCLAVQAKATTSAVIKWNFGTGTEVDMTGKLYIQPMQVTGVPDTKVNGGYRLYAEDSSGNYGTWYVAGKDTWPGGWGYFAIAPQTPPTYYNGSINAAQTLINYASVRYLGLQFKTLSTITGTNPNCFWDICWRGTGLTVTSAASDGVTPASLLAADQAGFWGIIQKVADTYAIQGLITLDNGSTGIDFTPNGDWLVWTENAFIPNSMQGLTVNGYASGTVNVELANCSLKGEGVTKPFINFSNANIDVGTIAGTTFINFAPSTFTGMDTITGSAFDRCGQVVTGDCVIASTAFRNSTDVSGSLLWPSDSTKAHDLSFLLCDKDIQYAATSDQTSPIFTNITHDDNAGDYDVNNTSGVQTISLTGTSNANSYTGYATTFSNPKTFSFTLSPSITGYEWRIYSVTAKGSLAGAVELAGEESATADNQTYPYEYVSDIFIAVQILAISGDYIESVTYYTLSNADQPVTINLSRDENN